MNKRQAQFAVQILKASPELSQLYDYNYVKNKREIYKDSYHIIVEPYDINDDRYLRFTSASDIMNFISTELPKAKMIAALD